METSGLAKIVKREFEYLVSKYGFESVKVRDLGREAFFEFERDLETISISLEVGSVPLIEVFRPAEQVDEEPTPWAEKNGVPRARLFPGLGCAKQSGLKDMEEFESCVAQMALAFESSESGWLHA